MIDHKLELKQAKVILHRVSLNMDHDKKFDEITDEKRDNYEKTIMTVLDTVGFMSQTISDKKEEMEKEYREKYHKQPALGRKLVDDDYYQKHEPYDQVKEQAWDLLDKLKSSFYIKK